MKESIDNNPGFYAILPANVRYDSRLTFGMKMVYAELTSLCNARGYSWATNRYIAELFGIDKTSVSRMISKLSSLGYIKLQIVRDKDTNQVLERRIYIHGSQRPQWDDIEIPDVVMGSSPIDPEVNTPIDRNVNTPIDLKVKENIKRSNKIGSSREKTSTTTWGVEIKEVFDYWKTELNKSKSVLNDSKKRKISARLNEGFTVDDLKQVITGVKKSPHHMGDNDSGMRYVDIEIIYRSDTSVNRFLELAASKQVKSKDGVTQRVVHDGFKECVYCKSGVDKPCPVHGNKGKSVGK